MAPFFDSLKRYLEKRTNAWRGLVYLPVATSLIALAALTLNIAQRIEAGAPETANELLSAIAAEPEIEKLAAMTMIRHRATAPSDHPNTVPAGSGEVAAERSRSESLQYHRVEGHATATLADAPMDQNNGQARLSPQIPQFFVATSPLVEFPEPAAGPDEPVACEAFDAPLDQVAKDLLNRKKQLDERSEEVELQTEAMRVMRGQLEADIERLERARDDLEAAVAKVDEGEEKRLQQLVKVYESMKAKKAAEIFDRLGLDVVISVATRMREAKLADILAAMNPDRARLVTAQLATELSPQGQ